MKKLLLLPALLLLVSAVATAQCNGRYYDELFSVKSTSNIPFGRNAEFDGDSIDLLMNVYEPDGDNFARRPLLVFAFGGSFTAGTRFSPDILTLCDRFAKRGYVTATIDYRLGFEDGNDSDTNQFKALIRGIQDMKAALRFFYKDAATVNDYRIDTTQIFCGGVSAGGFIALNHGYFKDSIFTNPPPDWVQGAYDEVGGIEGQSGNPGYSTKVKGVINLCGALADTLWIQPTDPVLVSVHGTADDLVAYTQDTTSVEGMLMGSGLIHIRANNVGLPNHLHSFTGAGHVPFILPIPFIPPASQYMDSTIWTVRDFLFQHVECDTATVSGVEDKSWSLPDMVVYPNPATNNIAISLNQIAEELRLIVYDIRGKQITEYTIGQNNNSLILSAHNLGKGIFLLLLKDKEGSVLRVKKLVIN
ncbi:MAG: hypothetical protein POELPBGB_02420 [Bacteroidia bacterium]|nr:hypothetical protein [Bacteroidia bacterium]